MNAITATTDTSNLDLNTLLDGITVSINCPECTHGWSPRKETQK